MSSDKKIIIDEDWKSQVEAEKQAAHGGAHNPQAAEAAGRPGGGPTAPGQELDYPPAAFDQIVAMFVSEALAGLGVAPHPATGEPQIDLPLAKYAIDMLEVLMTKTKGNLSPPEEEALEASLHELRLAYVQSGGRGQ